MSHDYDRVYGKIVDIAPMTRPSTITDAVPIAGNVTTWIVQSADYDAGPVVFLQTVDAGGSLRLVIPPKVVAAMVRQWEGLRDRRNDRRSEERKEADRRREAKRKARAQLARLSRQGKAAAARKTQGRAS